MYCVLSKQFHRRLCAYCAFYPKQGAVLFIEDSQFSLSSGYQQKPVCREIGTRYHPANIVEIETWKFINSQRFGDLF